MKNKLVIKSDLTLNQYLVTSTYMEDKRVHLIVEGKVQGVFYRASARDAAVSLGLRGYVKNLPDGNVELVAEGPTEKLDQIIEWCKTGPADANVSEVSTAFSASTGEFNNFHIQY